DAFGKINGIEFQPELKNSFGNRWLTTILVDPERTGTDKEKIRLELNKYNIESRPLWKPMHLQPVFKGCDNYVNKTCEKMFDRGLCLPSDTKMTDAQIDEIISIMAGLLKV
ncbi:MAG: DegT/DnrJ/EryC1/StrS family aminotransferase, partial [Candidatus Delongbacteria bacterium]|nr:DegT/DnrJ/EryC1/StrS family aminotransferase [Candidatus Delongbacteria bacterium]MCG2760375.1 DegT/DnrJ/EryC1/StrS family aminotransferase [Candidatus Delongbacteria bacterium]